MKKNGSTQNKQNKKKIYIAAVIFFSLTIITAVTSTVLFLSPRSEVSCTIRIPENAGIEQVTDSMTSKFGKKFTSATLRIAGMLGFDPEERYGAYLIEKGSSPFAAARKIARGAQTPVKITINGFRDREELMESISAKFAFSEKEFKKALYDPSFLSSFNLDRENATVLFLNDTYEFYWTDSPDKVIRKISESYSNYWNQIRQDKASRLGIKPHEAVIIASIVDEETNMKDEKGTVGRLYINRLNKGMRLQADPTVRYAAGDFTIKRVTTKHLHINSPYNTYRNNGLPPGPIRTVSTSTIDAILDSRPSDFLYMCARPDFSGYHDFTSSFNEHKNNATAYRNALDKMNIHN